MIQYPRVPTSSAAIGQGSAPMLLGGAPGVGPRACSLAQGWREAVAGMPPDHL